MPTQLTCEYQHGTAALRFDGREVRLWCDHPDHRAPELYDFTLFAAALIGMHFSIDITLELPVSARAARNINAILDAFECWRFGDIRRPEINLTEIVDDAAVPESGTYRGLYFSAGVDSTYSLISDTEPAGFSHALLVHGTDYLISDVDSFRDRRSYVEKVCDKVKLEPIIVGTDIRNTANIPIEYFNALIYAMCGHFVGNQFSSLLFSADHNHAQEFVVLPYNNSFTCQRLSGASLQVEYFDPDVSRFEKLSAIIADGRYADDLKVCWFDRSSGRNCGKCTKCTITRTGLSILGVDASDMFDAAPDILISMQRLKVPKAPLAAAISFIHFQDLYRHCPPGELRDTLYKVSMRCFQATQIAEPPTRKRHGLSRLLRRALLRY